MSFMARRHDLYTWPEPADIAVQPKTDVICRINPPTMVNKRSQFQFRDEDFDYVRKNVLLSKASVYFK